MTLYELGMQYLEEEKRLRARLKELRTLEWEGDPVLQRRIYYLGVEATQCRKTGLYLINYYGEENHE